MEQTRFEELVWEVSKGLHDLCQPLTALQCRLYLGSTEEEPSAMVGALEESLKECERVMDQVRQLQEKMQDVRVKTGEAR